MNKNLEAIIKAVAAGGAYGLCAYAYRKLTRVVTVNANADIPNESETYPIWCGERASRGDKVIYNGHIWQCVSVCTYVEPSENSTTWRMIDYDLAIQQGINEVKRFES